MEVIHASAMPRVRVGVARAKVQTWAASPGVGVAVESAVSSRRSAGADAVLCVGGPVYAVSWLPQVRGLVIGGVSYRFLAVAMVPESHRALEFRCAERLPPAFVQIWAVPCGEEDTNRRGKVKVEQPREASRAEAQPVLCYAVRRSGAGFVRDVAWCPSFGDAHAAEEGRGGRLGVVCAGFGNGEVGMWAVPVPSAEVLRQRRSRPEDAEVCPAPDALGSVGVAHNYPSSDDGVARPRAYPTKVAWHPQAPHDRVLVGCSDGRVVLLGLREGEGGKEQGQVGDAECMDEDGDGGVGTDMKEDGGGGRRGRVEELASFELDREGQNRVSGLSWAPSKAATGQEQGQGHEVTIFAAITEFESGTVSAWDVRDPSLLSGQKGTQAAPQFKSCLTSFCWPPAEVTLYPSIVVGKDSGHVALYSMGTKVPHHWLANSRVNGPPLAIAHGTDVKSAETLRDIEVPTTFSVPSGGRRKRTHAVTVRTTRSAVLDVAVPRPAPSDPGYQPGAGSCPVAYATACGNVAVFSLEAKIPHVHARAGKPINQPVLLASTVECTSTYVGNNTGQLHRRHEGDPALSSQGLKKERMLQGGEDQGYDDADNDGSGEDDMHRDDEAGDMGGGEGQEQHQQDQQQQQHDQQQQEHQAMVVKGETGMRSLALDPYTLDVAMREEVEVKFGGSTTSAKPHWREESAYKLDTKVSNGVRYVPKARDAVQCVAWGECPYGDPTVRWLAHGGGAGLVRVQLCEVKNLKVYNTS